MKSFISYLPEQVLLLPPSLEDWLPEEHLARFLHEVTAGLDLSELLRSYEEDGRGQSAYHPLMMVRLLLYGYCLGLASSRGIERATHENVAFRYLACNQHPDHSTISGFRQRHQEALGNLFLKVLALCREAGLVKLGHVALDGTQIKANASSHKTLSYEKLQEREKGLAAVVEALLAAAEQVDAGEEAQAGSAEAGELPPGLRKKQQRLEKIRAAKARLEEGAREKAEAAPPGAAENNPQGKESAVAESGGGASAGGTEEPPAPNEKTNLTDPDSRLLRDGASKGWVQGYNAQAAVDQQAQIIVAAEVTQDHTDRTHLCPLVQQVQQNLGASPEKVSADTGYWSPTAVSSPVVAEIDLYIRPDAPPRAVREAEQRSATGVPLRKKKPRSGYAAEGLSRADALRLKLQTPEGKAIYAKRREIVEPVFGQVKQRRGFRQFLLRGLQAVQQEWKLICLTHNLLKLYRYHWLTVEN